MNKTYENYRKSRGHEFLSPAEKVAMQKDDMQSYLSQHNEINDSLLQRKKEKEMVESIAKQIVAEVDSLLK